MTVNIHQLLAPKAGHDDTVTQAQIRECLIASMADLPPEDQVGVALDLIALLQFQALPALSIIRREATRAALEAGMSHKDLAAYTGFSMAVIGRLATEANRQRRWDQEAS